MTDIVRYRAYISYSHSDERFATWLHRQIETYRLPKHVANEKGFDTLKPVFQDRADLPSSANLSDSLKEAIAGSEALIVVCSRKAADSQWVGQEIDIFRQTHGDRRIFAIIADDPPPDCFPAALLKDADGRTIEPIAADARRGFDGRRDALLKILAGLLDVPFDGLKQRDLRRQVRRRTIATTTAGGVAAVTLFLAVAAQDARNDAERRRTQAEGLISFMLGDLRSRLEPIGRLDVLDAVGDKAMDYFGSLDKDELTPAAQLGSAQALRQIGEVRLSQGDLERASEAFRLSNEQTRRLLDADWNVESVEFELSQSHFWVGFVYLERSDVDRARDHFKKYLELSESLLGRNPDSTDYQVELGYALINLGTLELAEHQFAAAEEYFVAAAGINEGLLEQDPDDPQRLDNLATNWSWLGAVASQSGDIQAGVEWYSREYELRARAIKDRTDWLETQLLANTAILLGHQQLLAGQPEAAHQRFTEALELGERLSGHDPENALWQRLRGFAELQLARTQMILGDLDRAQGYAEQAVADLLPLARAAPDDVSALTDLLKAYSQQALVLRAAGDDPMARKIVTDALAQYPDRAIDEQHYLIAAAGLHLLDGDLQSSAGDADAAKQAWKTSAALLGRLPGNRRETHLLLTRMMIAERLRDVATADRIWEELRESGYRDRKDGMISRALVSGPMTQY
ncbi:MAG: TIR domain-containing protein [Gammaproteobacteria bacterium]|jgi:tetratricopeptide (TPR) repeat protein